MIDADVIKGWLTEQTSYTYRPDASTIRVMEDPQVRGTWAVRFTDYEEERTVDLLFVTEQHSPEAQTDIEILEETLEEVEFEQWPPKSGSLKFFF